MAAPARPILPRQTVEGYRRDRVVEALTVLAHRDGNADLTVTQIVKQAHMSRKTFYQLFTTKSECMRLAFRIAFDRLFDPPGTARDESKPWLERLSLVLSRIFATIAAEPLFAELCLVHSRSAPAEAKGHDHEAAVEVIALAMRGGREAARAALGADYRDPPPRVEDFLARAIVSLAALRIRQGEAGALPAHQNELVRLAATSFYGPEATAKVMRDLEPVQLGVEPAA